MNVFILLDCFGNIYVHHTDEAQGDFLSYMHNVTMCGIYLHNNTLKSSFSFIFLLQLLEGFEICSSSLTLYDVYTE